MAEIVGRQPFRLLRITLMVSTRSIGFRSSRRRPFSPVASAFWVALVAAALPSPAHASFLSPEMEDKVANVLALFVLFVVPVALIVLFWMVHVLPEKIAHKRHHPQFEAIRTLCLLSLVFGGLLWPVAWIWAYTRPVLHKMAYGTDKATHDVDAEGSAWDEGQKHAPAETATPVAGLGLNSAPAAALGLHERLARLEERGVPASEFTTLRADLDALEAKLASEGR